MSASGTLLRPTSRICCATKTCCAAMTPLALKSLDIFSVHGFPVGLIQCESNFLGIMEPDKNICIGSGGWANIIEKFRKAKSYCDSSI